MLHSLIITAIYCLWCPISQEFRVLTKAYRCTHFNTFASTPTHLHSLSHTHTHMHTRTHTHTQTPACTQLHVCVHNNPPPPLHPSPHILKLHIQIFQESAVQVEHTHIPSALRLVSLEIRLDVLHHGVHQPCSWGGSKLLHLGVDEVPQLRGCVLHFAPRHLTFQAQCLFASWGRWVLVVA